jgi:hypothetical protein
VLYRALDPEVDQRYPSAVEFLQALNRATASHSAGRPDWARAAARWLRLPPPED